MVVGIYKVKTESIMRINRTLIGLILMFSAAINSCIPTTQPEQMNILWLVAEDLSSMYLSMYGDSSAFTPNLNRLANLLSSGK